MFLKIDKQFLKQPWQYCLQVLGATLFVGAVLLGMMLAGNLMLLKIMGVGSLAATAFTIFATPKASAAQLSNIAGGYLVCFLVGIVGYEVRELLTTVNIGQIAAYAYELSAFLAITIAMFVMVLFNFEHPAAMGMVLGLVVEEWTYGLLGVLIVAVIGLILLKVVLHKRLISLV